MNRKADVYDCENGHRFAVIHEKTSFDVQTTVPCPFCPQKLADYAGSFSVEVPQNFPKTKEAKE